MLGTNPILSIRLNSGPGFFTNLAIREYFLHGCPIRPDPPSTVPAVPVGGTPICVKLYSPVFQKVENAYRLLSYLEI